MIRTTLARAHIKRTIRPLYAFTQSTPKGGVLDSTYDRDTDVRIFPGMVMMKTSGNAYTVIDDTGVPAGLSALYVGGDGIDELLETGTDDFTVWVMDPSAEFEVLAPAFDTDADWTDPGDGTDLLVYGQTAGAKQGRLVPAGTAGASTNPVGRLIEMVSPTKIVVGGLMPRTP